MRIYGMLVCCDCVCKFLIQFILYVYIYIYKTNSKLTILYRIVQESFDSTNGKKLSQLVEFLFFRFYNAATFSLDK